MDIFKHYNHQIFETYQNPDAREESFYGILSNFLYQFQSEIHITTLPKKTEAGCPDFKVTQGLNTIGYIEAKKPLEDLDKIEDSPQLKRYRETFPNLILTNFLEFRLYRNGEIIQKTEIARELIFRQVKTIPPFENKETFLQLMETFFTFNAPSITSSEDLAEALAKKTAFLRDNIGENFNSDLEGFYTAFKDYLIPSLTKEQFADIYAQTVTYGLFIARIRANNGIQSFSRETAANFIPATIGFLHDVFQFISFGQLPISLKWIIDDITEILRASDMKSIVKSLYTEHDPIIHFYETFLSVYDPQLREKAGVYYTPLPVVEFIIRTVNTLLKERFYLKDGLADKSVTLLDPASGTTTFLVSAIGAALNEIKEKYGDGLVKGRIEDHILNNFYGFELLMAPYAIGHLKLNIFLSEFGYIMPEDKRFKLYLTNTLDFKELEQLSIPILSSLSRESHLAGEVKRDAKILCLLGNPPYSSSMKDRTDFSKEAMKLYTIGLGVENERKKGVMQDDYIHFMRFAHYKIEQSGRGIIGFITNNSYLDGLIHRQMRMSLLQTFDEIYILNLHGNSRIREKCPDGSKDENVFDIQQGVAISIFVKHDSEKTSEYGKVFYCDVYGLRENKFNFLDDNRLETIKWKKLKPSHPNYFFVPKDIKLESEYKKFPSVTEMFQKWISGAETRQDAVMVQFKRKQIEQVIKNLISDKTTDELREMYSFTENANWKLNDVREYLKNTYNPDNIIQYCYRPLDTRWVYFDKKAFGRPRKPLMDNMLHENLGLMLMREYFYDRPISNFFIVNKLADSRIGLSNRGSAYLFPLYIYQKVPSPRKRFQFNGHVAEPPAEYLIRIPNLSEKFVKFITQKYDREFVSDGKGDLKKAIGPENILAYIYAVLYSKDYRERYQDFLKTDFPRIPFADFGEFKRLSELGSELVALHTMKHPSINETTVKFSIAGENIVRQVRYDSDNKRVFINDEQYFEGIEESIWSYLIGGYQVLDRWLKYRISRSLDNEDIIYFMKIAKAIEETIKIEEAL